MPELGDIKRARELGYKGNTRYIYAACPDCGRQRWVGTINTSARYRKCRTCAPKSFCNKIVKTCLMCGTRFSAYPSAIKRGFGKYCSVTCYKKHTFVGRYESGGYIRIWVSPNDFFYPMAYQRDMYGGYILEHRLTMAKHLNRCLLSWEVVHHKNGKKGDNRLENLELLPSSKYHVVDSVIKGQIQRLEKRVTLLEAENVLLRQQLAELQGSIA